MKYVDSTGKLVEISATKPGRVNKSDLTPFIGRAISGKTKIKSQVKRLTDNLVALETHLTKTKQADRINKEALKQSKTVIVMLENVNEMIDDYNSVVKDINAAFKDKDLFIAEKRIDTLREVVNGKNPSKLIAKTAVKSVEGNLTLVPGLKDTRDVVNGVLEAIAISVEPFKKKLEAEKKKAK